MGEGHLDQLVAVVREKGPMTRAELAREPVLRGIRPRQLDQMVREALAAGRLTEEWGASPRRVLRKRAVGKAPRPRPSPRTGPCG